MQRAVDRRATAASRAVIVQGLQEAVIAVIIPEPQEAVIAVIIPEQAQAGSQMQEDLAPEMLAAHGMAEAPPFVIGQPVALV